MTSVTVAACHRLVKFFGRERKGAEGDAAQMTLMDHLRELRNRLIKSVIVIVLGGIVCYIFYDQIFRLFVHPYCVSVEGTKNDCQLYLPDLLNGFLLRMKVATYGGLIVALPVILWQLWRFIMPALYKKERRYAIYFVGQLDPPVRRSAPSSPTTRCRRCTSGSPSNSGPQIRPRRDPVGRPLLLAVGDDDDRIRHRLRVPDPPGRAPARRCARSRRRWRTSAGRRS